MTKFLGEEPRSASFGFSNSTTLSMH